MSYLLDTCTISDFFKKNSCTIKHFEAIAPEEIFISAITVMEIEYGLNLNPEKEIKIRPLWKTLLNHIIIVPYSQKCAIASTSIRANLKTVGLSIGPYDILIAGTSLAHNMVMVTANTNEFERVPEIILENWRT